MEYRESQKFNQWWLWLIIFFALAMTAWASYTTYLDNETMVIALLPLIILIGLVFIPLALLELRTLITDDGVEVRFWPFSRRRIFKSEIKSMRVCQYSPLGEYGGWGYRVSSQGKAYNMMGKQGLQLELNNGEKILIGTQRPEELSDFLEAYFNRNDLLSDQAVTLKLQELRENKLEP
jgi:hypothetical protein